MRTPRKWIVGLALAIPVSASAMNLEEYLGQVTQRHRGLEAMRSSIEAAEKTRTAGDMELSPKFTLQGSYLSDKKQPGMLGATETKTESYSANLSKRFSTGTDVTLKAQSVGIETMGLAPETLALLGQSPMYGQGGLGISLSQSLWKNAFGRSTDLRREREAAIAQADAGTYDLQSRQILVRAEGAFWDLAYLQEEVKVREASLERSKKLETWLRRRQSDGIADRADLLNAQSLTAARELQLQTSRDLLIAAERNLRDYLEMAPNEPVPVLQGQISQARDPKQLVGDGARIVSLNTYLASLQSTASAVGAREAEEGTKADLVLAGSYMTNSYAPGGTAEDGTREWDRTNTPTAQVSLTWTYLFETDAKQAVRDAARGKALAAKLQSERAALEGATAWEEMQRRHAELSRQIQAAETLRKIQTDLAKAQQDKYARGRAITSEVINSEQAAEEAELTLTKMKTEQRKLEAQSRLFVAVKE